MRVWIDQARQDKPAGRVDDVAVARDALADFGDFAVADQEVGLPLAIGGDHRSATNQHHLAHVAHGKRASPLNSTFSRRTPSASSALALPAGIRDASLIRRAQWGPVSEPFAGRPPSVGTRPPVTARLHPDLGASPVTR